jgi:hypothetical protein
MPNPLKIAPPPRRPNAAEMEPAEPVPLPVREAEPGPGEHAKPVAAGKFRQVKEDERVQFNKRVTQGVADGFELLAIRLHRRVPDLLSEALELLQERYGKV